MKTILLFSISVIVIAATCGCLKDSQQPVTHINDVNISLTGTWTQNKGTITYYDGSGSQLYQINSPKLNLQFDGQSAVTITPDTTGSISESYNITTSADTDYVNLIGNLVNHKYRIVALHSRDLTLSEKINYPQGDTVMVGGSPVIYFSTLQVNAYTKNDLPRN